MSEFKFGERVWFYAGHGDGSEAEPWQLKEGLVVATSDESRSFATENGWEHRMVRRVHVAYCVQASETSSPSCPTAGTVSIAEEGVFRSKKEGAKWARAQIDARIEGLRRLRAQWDEEGKEEQA